MKVAVVSAFTLGLGLVLSACQEPPIEADGSAGTDETETGDGDGDPTTTAWSSAARFPRSRSSLSSPTSCSCSTSWRAFDDTGDHDADPNTAQIARWKSLHNVVSLIVDSAQEQFEFGVQLYPSTDATNMYNESACLVNDPPEVGIAPGNAVNVRLGIPAPTHRTSAAGLRRPRR